MAKTDGFIKLHRSIMMSDVYENSKTLKVYIHCLLRANHKESVKNGIKIERGSFVTSIRKMAKECNMTESEIRTHIATLEATHNITHKATRKYTHIYIVDFEKYNTQNNTHHNTNYNTKYNDKQEYKNKEYKNSASQESDAPRYIPRKL